MSIIKRVLFLAFPFLLLILAIFFASDRPDGLETVANIFRLEVKEAPFSIFKDYEIISGLVGLSFLTIFSFVIIFFVPKLFKFFSIKK